MISIILSNKLCKASYRSN